jgi:hypothetical protein
MDEIAKEYDVIVLGTGENLSIRCSLVNAFRGMRRPSKPLTLHYRLDRVHLVRVSTKSGFEIIRGMGWWTD